MTDRPAADAPCVGARTPRTLPRLALAGLVGSAFAGYAAWWAGGRSQPSDFLQIWWSARLLLDGQDPYEVIGPGLPVPYPFPLFYPLPAAVAAVPFTWLTPATADVVFVGAGAALLAWTLTRRTLANPQLVVFASFPMMVTAQTVQWSPWLTAAAFVPWLGWLLACKPTVGAALLVAYPSRLAAVPAVVFAAATVLVWPSWPAEWLARLPAATHMSAPVMRWGGPLILLSLLRWRRPEARLLAALACVPQTPVLYEAIPLFLVVRTFREGTLLVVLTGVMGRIVSTVAAGADYGTWMALNGQWMVAMVYLPCVLLVLRRPNDGEVPGWLARYARRSEHRCGAADTGPLAA